MSTKNESGIIARICWFNPGKGYGYAEDLYGNMYFVYGQELGGDMYGNNCPRTPKSQEMVEILDWHFWRPTWRGPNIKQEARVKSLKFLEAA